MRGSRWSTSPGAKRNLIPPKKVVSPRAMLRGDDASNPYRRQRSDSDLLRFVSIRRHPRSPVFTGEVHIFEVNINPRMPSVDLDLYPGLHSFQVEYCRAMLNHMELDT